MHLNLQNRLQHCHKNVGLILALIETDHGRGLILIQHHILRRKLGERKGGHIGDTLITCTASVLLNQAPYILGFKDIQHHIYNVELRFRLIIFRQKLLLQIQLNFIGDFIIFGRFINNGNLTLLVGRKGCRLLFLLILRLAFLF